LQLYLLKKKKELPFVNNGTPPAQYWVCALKALRGGPGNSVHTSPSLPLLHGSSLYSMFQVSLPFNIQRLLNSKLSGETSQKKGDFYLDLESSTLYSR